MTAKITAALHLSLPAAGLSIQLPVEYRVDNDRVWVSPLQLLKFKVLRGPLESAQYASNDYVKRLEEARMVISMSHPARPWENAYCESFMSTLKRQQISCPSYAAMEDLQTRMTKFIDQFYNVERLHSALAYCSPAEFEKKQGAVPPARMSFPRHEEIYPDA